MKTCHFHEARPGVGICMRCRAVICSACRTRVNGVNHCHACLKALGRGSEEVRSSWWALKTTLLLGAAWLALLGLCWTVSGTMAP